MPSQSSWPLSRRLMLPQPNCSSSKFLVANIYSDQTLTMRKIMKATELSLRQDLWQVSSTLNKWNLSINSWVTGLRQTFLTWQRKMTKTLREGMPTLALQAQWLIIQQGRIIYCRAMKSKATILSYFKNRNKAHQRLTRSHILSSKSKGQKMMSNQLSLRFNWATIVFRIWRTLIRVQRELVETIARKVTLTQMRISPKTLNLRALQEQVRKRWVW